MTDHLLKLASLGTTAILTPPLPSEASLCADYGPLGAELFKWLSDKNGFYAFESALHVFPVGRKAGVMDLEEWNSPAVWRCAYGDLANHCMFFGEDIFGNQFCLAHDGVGSFDAETGDLTLLAENLENWAELLLREFAVHTGYSLGHEWQSGNRALKTGERLVPKIPFVTGGQYTSQNLYAIEAVKGMRLRGDLAQQIRDLPDGTRIRYEVV